MLEQYWNHVTEYLSANPSVVLIVIGGVWLLGLILGLTKVITVYRDFNDVGLVGLTVALPVAVMMSLLGVGVQKFDFLLTPFLWFEAAMALLILVRTFVDNRNPLKAILAFLVKIPSASFSRSTWWITSRQTADRIVGLPASLSCYSAGSRSPWSPTNADFLPLTDS